MLKKVSNKENVFMFFRDKLRHGPFPKLKTAIFIKIAKINKNQIFVDAQMHQDSNVRSLMRFAELYNLELHLMTKVEHEKHVKPSLQSLGSASIQPRKSHLKVNVPLLK